MTRIRAIGVVAAVVMLVACDGGDASDGSASSPTATSAESSSDAEPSSSGEVDDASTPATATTVAPSAVSESPPGTTPVTVSDEGVSLGALGDTQVDITTEDGAVQIGSGTVPDVAAEVPVPDDLEVQLASVSGESAGFSGRTSRSPEDLATFYREELPAAGFEIIDDQTLGSTVFIVFVRAGETGQVAISDTPGADGATIVVAFGPA